MKINGKLPAALTLAIVASCSSSGSGTSSEQTVTIGAAYTDLAVMPLCEGRCGTNGDSALTPYAIKGTYGASCKTHGGEAWDIPFGAPPNSSFAVVLNDTFANCPLTLTAITMKSGGHAADYLFVKPIVLGLGYAATASAVDLPDASTLAFYANAEILSLSGPTYTNNFVINVVYSDDEVLCGTTTPPAVAATVTATATDATVAPPAYQLDANGLKFVVDANQAVQSTSTGAIVLTLASGAQAGEEWKIFNPAATCSNTPCSFADIDQIYGTTPFDTGTITGTGNITLPWTDWMSAGATLPGRATLIAKHTGAGSVVSYELSQVLFPGATFH